MRFAVAAVVLASLVFAACGEEDSDTAGDPANAGEASGGDRSAGVEGPASDRREKPEGADGSPGAREASGSGTVIATGSSEFGEILFDDDRRAIYLFDKETSAKSECYGDCAEAWPPVITDGEPQADGAVDSGLLGTTERDDGTTQVTYDGQPLYYYVDDPPGQVLCHNVEEFGGLWLVLGADGAALA